MRISILLTCFTILISTFGSAQQIKRNLIANSCFEEGLKHWYTTCEPNINVNYYIDKDTPISGSASALISVQVAIRMMPCCTYYSLWKKMQNIRSVSKPCAPEKSNSNWNSVRIMATIYLL